MPASTSECPPKYFVAECTTRSTPRSRARWIGGGAKVPSKIVVAPAALAAATTARTSTTRSVGLIGDSKTTSFAGRCSCQSKPGRSSAEKRSTVMPKRTRSCSAKPDVPP